MGLLPFAGLWRALGGPGPLRLGALRMSRQSMMSSREFFPGAEYGAGTGDTPVYPSGPGQLGATFLDHYLPTRVPAITASSRFVPNTKLLFFMLDIYY